MKLVSVLVSVAALLGMARDEENHEYKMWSGFKKGAWVKYKTVSEAAGFKTELEQTITLADLTAEKASIETIMVMSGNKLPAQKRDIPAKVKVEGQAKGDAPKPKEGDEEIEVGGQKVKCHWIETTTEAGGNKTVAKIWQSKDIPGGMAKMESNTTGAATVKMNMSAVEWKKE